MRHVMCVLTFLLSVVPGFAQTIFIANSNPGAPGGTNVFTGNNSINNALTSAANGDIIYVVPSGVTYLSPTLGGKGVSIIGGGFNPDKPGAALSTLADVNANANNCRLSGLVINGIVNFQGTFSNIIIDKCRILRVFEGNTFAVGNLIIQNCIIGENNNSGGGQIFLQSASTVRISNNIIYCQNQPGISLVNAITIENNIFIGGVSGSTVGAFSNVTNSDIKNNIFYGVRPGIASGVYTGNTQQNNLSYGASDNTFSTITSNTSINNLEGLDPLFVNLPYVPFGTSHSFSYSAALQVGSPAIGSGLGGIDMGIFGGLTPYDIYGTSLPIVQSIIAPSTHTLGTDMTVRVKAKGN